MGHPVTTAVKIDAVTGITVPDSVELHKSGGDDSEWASNGTVTVEFPTGGNYHGTPFKEHKFVVTINKPMNSGAPVPAAVICKKCDAQPAATHHHYKYRILNKAGQVINDPEIIIRN